MKRISYFLLLAFLSISPAFSDCELEGWHPFNQFFGYGTDLGFLLFHNEKPVEIELYNLHGKIDSLRTQFENFLDRMNEEGFTSYDQMKKDQLKLKIMNSVEFVRKTLIDIYTDIKSVDKSFNTDIFFNVALPKAFIKAGMDIRNISFKSIPGTNKLSASFDISVEERTLSTLKNNGEGAILEISRTPERGTEVKILPPNTELGKELSYTPTPLKSIADGAPPPRYKKDEEFKIDFNLSREEVANNGFNSHVINIADARKLSRYLGYDETFPIKTSYDIALKIMHDPVLPKDIAAQKRAIYEWFHDKNNRTILRNNSDAQEELFPLLDSNPKSRRELNDSEVEDFFSRIPPDTLMKFLNGDFKIEDKYFPNIQYIHDPIINGVPDRLLVPYIIFPIRDKLITAFQQFFSKKEKALTNKTLESLGIKKIFKDFIQSSVWEVTSNIFNGKMSMKNFHDIDTNRSLDSNAKKKLKKYIYFTIYNRFLCLQDQFPPTLGQTPQLTVIQGGKGQKELNDENYHFIDDQIKAVGL